MAEKSQASAMSDLPKALNRVQTTEVDFGGVVNDQHNARRPFDQLPRTGTVSGDQLGVGNLVIIGQTVEPDQVCSFVQFVRQRSSRMLQEQIGRSHQAIGQTFVSQFAATEMLST